MIREDPVVLDAYLGDDWRPAPVDDAAKAVRASTHRGVH